MPQMKGKKLIIQGWGKKKSIDLKLKMLIMIVGG